MIIVSFPLLWNASSCRARQVRRNLMSLILFIPIAMDIIMHVDVSTVQVSEYIRGKTLLRNVVYSTVMYDFYMCVLMVIIFNIVILHC